MCKEGVLIGRGGGNSGMIILSFWYFFFWLISFVWLSFWKFYKRCLLVCFFLKCIRSLMLFFSLVVNVMFGGICVVFLKVKGLMVIFVWFLSYWLVVGFVVGFYFIWCGVILVCGKYISIVGSIGIWWWISVILIIFCFVCVGVIILYRNLKVSVE